MLKHEFRAPLDKDSKVRSSLALCCVADAVLLTDFGATSVDCGVLFQRRTITRNRSPMFARVLRLLPLLALAAALAAVSQPVSAQSGDPNADKAKQQPQQTGDPKKDAQRRADDVAEAAKQIAGPGRQSGMRLAWPAGGQSAAATMISTRPSATLTSMTGLAAPAAISRRPSDALSGKEISTRRRRKRCWTGSTPVGLTRPHRQLRRLPPIPRAATGTTTQ